MRQNSHLHVNTDLQHLGQVLEWFNQVDPIPMPEADWLQCQIALAEGFTNAVRHAHQDLPRDTPIELELEIYPDHIEIRIWDLGPPFDLSQTLANLPEPHPLATGGRGLYLMHQSTDLLCYNRVNGHKNCLRMVKYISPTHCHMTPTPT